jgi:enoyl-CoA hydratase/carnithine racemase
MDLKTAIPIMTRLREPEAEKDLMQFGKSTGEAMLKPNIVNKPVIAAINGYCFTGGFEMVMGADLRIASDAAVFQMREAVLGVLPMGGIQCLSSPDAWLLPRHGDSTDRK